MGQLTISYCVKICFSSSRGIRTSYLLLDQQDLGVRAVGQGLLDELAAGVEIGEAAFELVSLLGCKSPQSRLFKIHPYLFGQERKRERKLRPKSFLGAPALGRV